MTFSTKKLARAAIIAALYAVLCWALAPVAFGPLQIRPAEALCILPLFYFEAVPGLWVGCMLANLFSGYGALDIGVGSLATLFAALCTWGIGKLPWNDWAKVIVGGLPVVLFNALIIPAVIILGSDTGWEAYVAIMLEMMLTESVWVYALGIPFYFGVKRLRDKELSVLI